LIYWQLGQSVRSSRWLTDARSDDATNAAGMP
jgi:hypothetical protein